MENSQTIIKTKEELRKVLTPEQYRITQEKGTERAFSGQYHDSKEEGMYTCVCCGASLFSSDTKYDSGTGWPSFYAPMSGDAVGERPDSSWFMRRTEAVCQHCGAHLGHVFDDGPQPTGKRYCMNSAALDFETRKKNDAPPSSQ